MSALTSHLPPLSTAMPVFTSLLGLTGLGGGLYMFTTPAAGPPLFGIKPLSSVTAEGSSSWATLRAYIRVHGIRNLSSGLTVLGLSLYSLFGVESPADAGVVRKCLGLMMLSGAPVAVGDGWLLAQYVRELKEGGEGEDEKEVKEAVKLGEEKSLGHFFTGVFIAAVGVGCLLS